MDKETSYHSTAPETIQGSSVKAGIRSINRGSNSAEGETRNIDAGWSNAKARWCTSQTAFTALKNEAIRLKDISLSASFPSWERISSMRTTKNRWKLALTTKAPGLPRDFSISTQSWFFRF